MEDNELLELIVKVDSMISESVKLNQYSKLALQFENIESGIEVVAIGCDSIPSMKSFVIGGTVLSGYLKGVFSLKRDGNKTSCQIDYFIKEDIKKIS